MKKIISLLMVVIVLTGCSTNHSQSSELSGVVLGWQDQLYKIVSTVSASNLGDRLGTAVYHGKVSGGFTVYELQGNNPEKSIVFGSSNGQYLKAVATNKVQ